MTCKDVKDAIEEYGTLEDLVKEICTDRVCTLDTIQNSLKEKNVEVTEPTLLAVISQIKEMMIFDKVNKYDIDETVIYQRIYLGITYRGEAIGNTIVKIWYKKFFLYSDKRYNDQAFREHIFSKLEFEELGRSTLDNADKVQKALQELNIERDKWKNYVYVGEKGFIYCRKWDSRGGHSDEECLGKLVRKTSSK